MASPVQCHTFHTMVHKLHKQQRLFHCANTIESLKCFQCANFETHNLAHLTHHIKAGHTLLESEEKLYECGSCSFRTLSSYLFLRHILFNLCMIGEELKCEAAVLEEIRELQFIDKTKADERLQYGLFDNLKTMHKSGKRKLRKCKYCQYTTTVTSNLKNHILAKHTDPDKIQWFKCTQCSYKGKRKFNLKSHIDNKHGKKKNLKCDHCSLETNSRQTLKRHILRKHTELEKIHWFECAQCPYKSKTKSNLKNHVDNKHGNKKYLKCDRCSFEAKYKWALKRHVLLKHTELEQIRWFECAQCPFKTQIKSNLKNHMDFKHGNTYLKCDSCPFETKFKDNLKNHVLLKHTDPDITEWFYCEHCSYMSPLKRYFQRHVARHQRLLKLKESLKLESELL